MTRFIHWSDLHTEFRPFDLPDLDGNFDAILLAGDTAVGKKHIDFLQTVWETYEKPVISIWGNHELYRTDFKTLREYEEDRLISLHQSGADIRVLHAETTKVLDATIFGATLWTDFELDKSQSFFAKLHARHAMSDFSLIRDRPGSQGRTLTPDASIEIHYEHRAALVHALQHKGDAPFIAMTHHMPSQRMVSQRFRGDLLNAAFASDLEAEIMEYHPDFWLYGHTHDGGEVDIKSDNGCTHIRHNPRGYPGETNIFDPYRVIDTERPDVCRLND